MLEQCFVGRGIDVSKQHHVLEASHRYEEPSQVYTPTKEIGVESLDYLYGADIINETKYYRILLYEWFLLIKENGYLIIDFQDNELLDHEALQKEIESMYLYNHSEIVRDQKEGKRRRLIVQKTKSVKIDEDEINQWTFGIVTNGKRKDLIELNINSIRNLNIPNYQIILCGTFYGDVAEDINYIHFAEHDDKGWITKKKNLICENAKYENIVVIHDRISFDKRWFEGMKKWGVYFDVLGCPVFYPNEKFSRNWDTMGFSGSLDKLNQIKSTSGRLDPTDWDRYVYISGPIIVLKKHIWELAKWDEELFWGDFEDIELSQRQGQKGIMLRLNPYAIVNSAIVTVPLTSFHYQKDKKKLGKYSMSPILSILLSMLDGIGLRRDQKIIRRVARATHDLRKTKNWTRQRN